MGGAATSLAIPLNCAAMLELNFQRVLLRCNSAAAQ